MAKDWRRRKRALGQALNLTAVKSRGRRGRAMLKKKLQACCRFASDRMGEVIDWERRRARGVRGE